MTTTVQAFSMPDGANIANGLTVTSGIITDTLSVTGSFVGSRFYATPSGSSGSPSFRGIVGPDLPIATTSSQGAIVIGNGITISGGIVSVVYGTGLNTAVQGNDTRLSSAAVLTGGTINGVTIGATTASTGSFTSLAATSLSVTGSTNFNNNTVTGIPTPVNPTDAVNLSYVSGLIQGIVFKPTAAAATSAALPTVTYANGSSGVGATLTATAVGTLTVDSYTVNLGDIILVKNQASTFQNGLYTCTTAGTGSIAFVLTRHVDMDASSEFPGAFIPVDNNGTINANSIWLCNPAGTVTVGTTAIPFTQLNASTSITQGTGILVSGTTVSVTTPLAAIAGVTPAANTVPYYTGTNTASTTSLTATGISIIGSASSAAAATAIGLGTGNNATFASIQNTPIGSTTANTIVGTTITANTSIIVGAFTASSITVNALGTGGANIDTWSNSTYRSAEYVIQVSQASGGTANTYMTTCISLICDGTNIYVTEYGTLLSATRLVNFTITFSGSTVTIAAAAVAGTVNVYMYKTLINV